MLKLYGIKNCDSVKKARLWLEQQEISYEFHDFKTEGLSAELLQHFLQNSGWDVLLNRRSTSWKQLTDAQRSELTQEKAETLMLTIPTLVKRPVLDTGTQILVGFDAVQYLACLKNNRTLE